MIGLPYFLLAAVIVTAAAAWFDRRSGEMPDVVTLLPLAAAPIAHGVLAAMAGGFSAAAQAVGFSILGAAACLLVPAALYSAGAIGGGDVKLFAAIGAMLRTLIGVEAEFYAVLAPCSPPASSRSARWPTRASCSASSATRSPWP
jgi:prepilin peptidase CpaA